MVYTQIVEKVKNGGKSFFLLIDPDKFNDEILQSIRENVSKIDGILVGGSLTFHPIGPIIDQLKAVVEVPVIIFPGNAMHLSKNADAILFLSLVSGRNPDFLIGNHILTAPEIVSTGMEAIPVGYILIEGGATSSVEYMSNTKPIPNHKPDIALATALAAKLLGMKMIYLEAGSGAKIPVSTELIKEIKTKVDLPLIVGGGIRSAKVIEEMYKAGADILVVGNHFEQDPYFLKSL